MTPLRKGTSRAFTLVELLIVIGIIAVIMSLLIVALRGVRAGANRADSLSTLRQLMTGHITYSGDHNQRFMPGYLDEPTLTSLGLQGEYGDDLTVPACTAGHCDAGSYVWRLAPYLDYNWLEFMKDYRSPQAEAKMQAEFEGGIYGRGSVGAGATNFGIAMAPSFGLNSIFVGGDTSHGGAYATAHHPWQGVNPTIAAVRTSEVKNPTRLIVFAATEIATPALGSLPNNPPGADITLGYCELRPPSVERDAAGNWVDAQWAIGAGGVYDYTAAPGGAYSVGGGVPTARWGDDLVPTATLDGSAHIENRFEIAVQMSRWWPFATGLR